MEVTKVVNVLTDVSEVSNSFAMWVFALIIICAVVVMVLNVWKITNNFSDKTNLLTKDERRSTIRTGGIVAIGPAIAVFVVAIGMISQLGAPLTLMRIGVIGSAVTEMTAADIGAGAAGSALGAEDYGVTAFTASVWTMAFMSMGYLLFVPFMTRGIDKITSKFNKSEKSSKRLKLFGTIFPVVLIAAFGIMRALTSAGHMAAFITAVVVMAVVNIIANRYNLRWLREWATAIVIVFGLVAGGLVG